VSPSVKQMANNVSHHEKIKIFKQIRRRAVLQHEKFVDKKLARYRKKK